MPILIILSVVIQAFFIYHVIRTGRPYWWAFVILSFPVAGSLIYYFVEVFPSSHEHRTARRAVREIVRAVKPDAELQRRAEEVAICGSMDNKLSLARECEQCGMHAEAVKLYESCLTGPFANDPQLLLSLATACFANGNFAQAYTLTERLAAEHAAFKTDEARLLQARIHTSQGNNKAALEIYEQLIPVYSGLEAQYRYALLLESMGQIRQAEGMLRKILEHAKRFNISHEGELQWVRLAKRSLASIGASAGN